MDNGIKNHLFTQIGIVLLTTGAVLIGGFSTSSVFGQAENSMLHFKTDFESMVSSQCTGGEDVIFSGTAQFNLKTTTLPSGTVHTLTHMNYQNMKGVGVVSGEDYIVREINNFIVNQHGAGGVFHTVIDVNLIHPGKGVNSRVSVELQTVMNPDGIPKLTVSHINVGCTGHSS